MEYILRAPSGRKPVETVHYFTESGWSNVKKQAYNQFGNGINLKNVAVDPGCASRPQSDFCQRRRMAEQSAKLRSTWIPDNKPTRAQELEAARQKMAEADRKGIEEMERDLFAKKSETIRRAKELAFHNRDEIKTIDRTYMEIDSIQVREEQKKLRKEIDGKIKQQDHHALNDEKESFLYKILFRDRQKPVCYPRIQNATDRFGTLKLSPETKEIRTRRAAFLQELRKQLCQEREEQRQNQLKFRSDLDEQLSQQSSYRNRKREDEEKERFMRNQFVRHKVTQLKHIRMLQDDNQRDEEASKNLVYELYDKQLKQKTQAVDRKEQVAYEKAAAEREAHYQKKVQSSQRKSIDYKAILANQRKEKTEKLLAEEQQKQADAKKIADDNQKHEDETHQKSLRQRERKLEFAKYWKMQMLERAESKQQHIKSRADFVKQTSEREKQELDELVSYAQSITDKSEAAGQGKAVIASAVRHLTRHMASL